MSSIDTTSICPECGSENDSAARFCSTCGAGLPVAAMDGELRKVVTVVFSDVVNSTRLGEVLDPEPLRHVMLRYFEEMRTVLERHGGVVEKYIGDAVMAVFGVPQLHEDDALRAVRAAEDMREALARLNDEFERFSGITLESRTGVNTGEVVTGRADPGQSLVTGDAINLAARLEQAAQAGEILVGEATYRLVRAAVVAEEVGALTVKGKADPVQAWRILEVVPGAAGWTRRLDSPLVGRERELATLRKAFERSVGNATCELVTVVGEAGIGKSRLTNEFLSRVDAGARVVTGRCLPYGEGITFWPIVAVLREAATIGDRDSHDEARRKIATLISPGDDSSLICDRLAALLGLGEVAPGIQETFWAVRKLFEHLGAARPLVVVVDDIQWGEPTFLDLLEYLSDWMRATPVLLLCLARPELLDSRPEWATGKANATTIPLQRLTGPEIDGLMRNLLGGAELAQGARTHIADVAEGNPLFVEETLRMLVDDDLLRPSNGRWAASGDLSRIAIPPTIHALLTARLDRLEPEERAVIERASVIGRVFWWGAVSELSPEDVRARVGRHLQSLMRKELIEPDESERWQEDAFRFTHILVRDAAYQRLPKALRAELHERFAEWIELMTKGAVGEYEEILGYHLEQAQRSLAELGLRTDAVAALGQRAAVPLASAGRRAFARGDMPAAVNLLARAASLLPEAAPERLELLPQLAFAYLETGQFERLQAVAEEAEAAAAASGDVRLQAHAVILGLWIGLFTNPEGWAEEAEAEATRAIAAFQDVGDDRGLAKAWSLLGLVQLTKTQFGPAEEAWEKAAEHAHRAGDNRDEMESRSWVPLAIWAGPTHVDSGLARSREVAERAAGDKKALASALAAQATFEAGLGHFEEARALLRRARALLEEVALTVWMAGPLAQFAAWVELLAGDPAAAERELRWGYETLKEIGEMAWLSTVVAILGEAVYAQGRHDEAETLTRESDELAGSEDSLSQVLWRSVRAKVLARRGEAAEAERLAREAATLAERTDFLHLRWFALMSLAEVLQLLGKAAAAREPAREALAVAERKGSTVGAERARALLGELEAAGVSPR